MAQLKSDANSGSQEGDLKSPPFENILNFRDVGKTINEFLGERYFMFAGVIERAWMKQSVYAADTS